MKYAELQIFYICVDAYKTYKGFDYDKVFEVLSPLKNKKIKKNDILIEKHKFMLEKQNFEQNLWSRTAEGVYKKVMIL